MKKFLNLLDALEMQENTNFVSFLEDFKKILMLIVKFLMSLMQF